MRRIFPAVGRVGMDNLSDAPTIAVIGTSISEQGAPVNNVGAAVNNYSISGVNWLNWMNYFCNQSFNIVKYSGHGGDLSAQVLARWSEVAGNNPKPDFVVIDAGINDISGSTTADQTIANIRQLCNQARSAGIICLLQDILPSLNFTTTAHAEKWVAINKWCADFARSTTGVHLWKVSDLWVNPAATAPQAYLVASHVYEQDGLHQSTLGAYLMGLRGYELIKQLMPINAYPLDNFRVPASTTSKNAIKNPGMVGTSGVAQTGNVTGTIPSNWNVGCYPAGASAVCSKVQRTDQAGMSWLQVAYTGAASGFANGTDRLNIYADGLALTSLPAEFAVTSNTKIRLLIEVEMDANPVAFRNMNADLFLQGSGGNFHQYSLNFANTGLGLGQPLNRQQQAGVLSTHPISMAALNALMPTLTVLTGYIIAYASDNNAAFTIRIGRAAIVPMDFAP